MRRIRHISELRESNFIDTFWITTAAYRSRPVVREQASDPLKPERFPRQLTYTASGTIDSATRVRSSGRKRVVFIEIYLARFSYSLLVLVVCCMIVGRGVSLAQIFQPGESSAEAETPLFAALDGRSEKWNRGLGGESPWVM